VKISFLLAAASIALSGFRRLVCRRGWSVAQVGKSLRAPFGLAAMAPFIGLFFALNLGGVRTTYRVDKTLGFYDSSMSPAILALLRAEAEQGGDKRLLVISPAKNWTPTEWQYLAGKSGITGDPYYLSQPDQIRAQQARNVVAADIAAGIGKGQVKAETAIDLARLDATLIAPVEAMPALHGWRVVLDGGDWKEFEPPTALSTDE
jgi:hypothetical protein